MTKRKKTVHFYELGLKEDRQPETRLVPPGYDYEQGLSAWAERTFQHQRIGEGDDTVYCVPTLDGDFPSILLYKPMNQDYVAKIDASSGDIADLIEGADEPGQVLANVTVFVLIPELNLFAYTRGSGAAPTHTGLNRFLQESTPFDGKYPAQWISTPVFDRGQLEKFKASAGGLVRIETAFTTVGTLDKPEGDKFFTAYDALAEQIGGEFEIGLTLGLDKTARQNQRARRKFKQFIIDSIERLVYERKKVRVDTIDDKGVREQIDLIAEKFSVQQDFFPAMDGPARISDLISGTTEAVEANLPLLRNLYGV